MSQTRTLITKLNLPHKINYIKLTLFDLDSTHEVTPPCHIQVNLYIGMDLGFLKRIRF